MANIEHDADITCTSGSVVNPPISVEEVDALAGRAMGQNVALAEKIHDTLQIDSVRGRTDMCHERQLAAVSGLTDPT
jgi:hypothetical protein